MKKVILAVAVLFSVAMVSCGGDKKAADSANVDSAADSTMIVEESVSETVVESVAAPAADSAAPAADSVK